jgi:hypothetical protein
VDPVTQAYETLGLEDAGEVDSSADDAANAQHEAFKRLQRQMQIFGRFYAARQGRFSDLLARWRGYQGGGVVIR